MVVYEIWKVKKGVLVEKVIDLLSYADAWNWVWLQSDSGSYVVRYFRLWVGDKIWK